MDNLTFDLHGVFLHSLTYTICFICLIHYNNKNSMLMWWFKKKTNAKYKLYLLILNFFQTFYLIIHSLNTWYLNQHYHDIIADLNFQASHILCFNETQIKSVKVECIVALTNHKYFVLSCYDGHDTIMFYDANNTLNIHRKHIKKSYWNYYSNLQD